jgi:polysaccharide biosynthesis/export protein
MTINRLAFCLSATSFLLGVTICVVAQQTQLPPEQSSASAASNATEFPCAMIAGAVHTPTRVELHRRMRLSELFTVAGGITRYAGRTVQITHHAEASTSCNQMPKAISESTLTSIVLNIDDVVREEGTSNPDVQPGDMVFVPEAKLVYVVGNVKNPQAIIFKEPMTLTEAIDLSGGVLPGSRLERISVIRQTDGPLKTELIIDLIAVTKHSATDVLLQPNDIIDIPMRHGHPGRPLPLTVSEQVPTRVIW